MKKRKKGENSSVGEDRSKSWHSLHQRGSGEGQCAEPADRVQPPSVQLSDFQKILHARIRLQLSRRTCAVLRRTRPPSQDDYGALNEASEQHAPPGSICLRELHRESYTSDMTEHIENAIDMSGDVVEGDFARQKRGVDVEDTVGSDRQEQPQPELPDGKRRQSHENEVTGSSGTSILQHESTSTPEQDQNSLPDPIVKVETTMADITASTSHDVSPLTVLPPQNTDSEQYAVLPYSSDVNDVEGPIQPHIQFGPSNPSDPTSQSIMAQPLDPAWQQSNNYHVEPYSSETEQHSLPPTGFAKLEFPDGHFYMTTYAVLLGRDMHAWKIAKRQAAIEVSTAVTPTKPRRSASLNDVPQTPGGKAIKINGSASVPRSFVSESGGIVGDEMGHFGPQSEKRKRKRSSKKSKSSDSAPRQIARKHSMEFKSAATFPDVMHDLELTTVDPNATAKLNPAEHVGDPNYVPLIPIHPPTDLENQGKGISREHVKIFYSFDHGRFEMEVLGRNGAFLDDQHFAKGSIVPLRDRSDIQIGGVNLTFVLPNAPVDGERTELSESISGRMSFTFEDSRGESVIASDMSDPEAYDFYDERRASHYENGFEDEFEEEDGMSVEQSVEQSDEEEDEEDEEEEPKAVYTKPRRGRPRKHPVQEMAPSRQGPKNGISRDAKDIGRTKIKINMSKRQKAKLEEQLRAEKRARVRAEKEAAKKKKSKARRVSMNQAANGSRVSPKESSKESSKTPATGAQNGEQQKPVRMARDEAMQNGIDFYDPKLPRGFVVPPRKKGPGRPPKDGVMSKREKALLIRQAKEEEKARRMGLDPSQLPPPEIKSTKAVFRRNSKGEVVDDAGEIGEPPKTARPPRPPRSPSPEMRIEDYSEEQLQRPNANYVILIYEAIKTSKTGKMNLQQIYSAIERQYPYFKFKTTSAGWQSSVRHNLSQHDAFVQVEKDGKGWLWGIKEGVPIERERRKKTPPPQPPPTQPRYPQQPYPYNGYPAATNRAGYQPPRFFPPTNIQSTEAKSQSYSSPYANDKQVEGAQATSTTAPNQPRTSYMPPSYSRPPSYAPPHSSATLPGSQNAPHQTQLKLSGNRNYRPSADVVETFRKVFVDSYQRKTVGMTPADALAMVNRAIKRVLHPETMESAQSDPDEMTVALAFESCIAKAVGPPRYVAPVGTGVSSTGVAAAEGGKARQDSPSVAVNIASTAAITAAASAAPGVRSTTPTGPAPAPSAKQNQTGAQPQPQRPAEANLLDLLTGARHSPALASAHPAPPASATSTAHIDAANVTGIAKMLEQPHLNGDSSKGGAPAKPDVEPLTPPAPSAAPQAGMKRAAPSEDNVEREGEVKRPRIEAEEEKE